MSNLLTISSDMEIILEMAFSAHCTSIWKFNGISRTSMSKVAPKCIWCCGWVQWCATVPHSTGRCRKIVQWAWNCDPDGHVMTVLPVILSYMTRHALQWRHNDHDGVSNHQPHGCLCNRLFRRWSKKTSKLRVTGLCVGNSPGPVNSPHKGPVTRKMLPFDDVIMRGAILQSHVGNCLKMQL